MKFTLDWLKEHLQTDVPAETIVDTLTMIGLEVEEVEDQAKVLEPFVVAHVIEAKPHPNSDHLNLCLVDDGSGTPIKVVCGAPNARTGMKGVFAPVGTYIPGTDFTLSKGMIRGEESNGMLCSERELLLSDNHECIIELPDDAPVGHEICRLQRAWRRRHRRGDHPEPGRLHRRVRHRPAISRRAGVGDLIDKAIMPVKATAGRNADPDRTCASRAIRTRSARCSPAVLSKTSRTAPPPQWLQDRLRAVGLRPINALADITNYISQDRGRPLHVYDADKIVGTLHARMGKNGETFNGPRRQAA